MSLQEKKPEPIDEEILSKIKQNGLKLKYYREENENKTFVWQQ
jgi:hypothetical protein